MFRFVVLPCYDLGLTVSKYLYMYLQLLILDGYNYLQLGMWLDNYTYIIVDKASNFLICTYLCDSYCQSHLCTVCVKKCFHTAVFNHRRYCVVQTVV